MMYLAAYLTDEEGFLYADFTVSKWLFEIFSARALQIFPEESRINAVPWVHFIGD